MTMGLRVTGVPVLVYVPTYTVQILFSAPYNQPQRVWKVTEANRHPVGPDTRGIDVGGVERLNPGW